MGLQEKVILDLQLTKIQNVFRYFQENAKIHLFPLKIDTKKKMSFQGVVDLYFWGMIKIAQESKKNVFLQKVFDFGKTL